MEEMFGESAALTWRVQRTCMRMCKEQGIDWDNDFFLKLKSAKEESKESYVKGAVYRYGEAFTFEVFCATPLANGAGHRHGMLAAVNADTGNLYVKTAFNVDTGVDTVEFLSSLLVKLLRTVVKLVDEPEPAVSNSTDGVIKGG